MVYHDILSIEAYNLNSLIIKGISHAEHLVEDRKNAEIINQTMDKLKNEESTFSIQIEGGRDTRTDSEKGDEAGIKKNKVLVVDDDQGVMQIACLLLEKLGFNVKGVTSGEEGLSILLDTENEVDFLVLDIVLKDASGLDVYKKVRKTRKDLPVLFISGYDPSMKVCSTLNEDPHTRFLVKPFGIKDLSRNMG